MGEAQSKVAELEGSVREGRSQEVEVFIQKKGKNKARKFLVPLLHRAARWGKPEIVLYLLSQGADPNGILGGGEEALDDHPQYSKVFGASALHIACLYGQPFVVKELLIAKADANAVCTLVTHVPRKEHTGMNPILCTFTGDPEKLQKERTIISQLLLGYGADLMHLDAEGNNYLHIAADKLLIDQCRIFIEKGININSTNLKGLTPFMALGAGMGRWTGKFAHDATGDVARDIKKIGINQRWQDDVRLFQHLGADVNARDRDGMNAMHWACYTFSYEIYMSAFNCSALTYSELFCGESLAFRFLRAAGVNPEVKEKRGFTPAMVISESVGSNVAREERRNM